MKNNIFAIGHHRPVYLLVSVEFGLEFRGMALSPEYEKIQFTDPRYDFDLDVDRILIWIADYDK